MGVGATKMDNSPLVSLCRERKELIRAAIDCRYGLATAHGLYFQSLFDVGHALNKFVEELGIMVDSSDEESSSEKDSHLKFPNSNSESELGSLTDYVHDDPDLSNGHKLYEVKNEGQTEANSSIYSMRRSSSEMVSIMHELPKVMPMAMQEQDSRNPFFNYPQYWNGASSSASSGSQHYDLRITQHNNGGDFHVPVSATIAAPQNNIREPNQSSRASTELLHHDPRLYQHVKEEVFHGLMDLQHNYAYCSEGQSIPATSPPPLPGISPWDYLDPFNMIDSVSFNYYHYQDRYESESSNLREVRETEGIPDLEDETEPKLVGEESQEKRLASQTMEGSAGGFSKAASSEIEEYLQPFQEKESKSDQAAIEKNVKGSETCTLMSSGGQHEKKKGLSFEASNALAKEDDSLRSINFSTLDASGSRDLQVVIKEIKDIFEIAFNYGKEITMLLEVGRLPHQPMGAKLKESALRFFGWMASSQHSTQMLLNHSVSKRLLVAKAIDRMDEENLQKFGDLSATLEKLYVWEKKLYEEVMVEEKLRVAYDRECKMLKNLDDRGAESRRIDNVHASIRRLLSKINVALRAVDVISMRVHKLRDDELYLQLIELIEGLMRMWKFLAECHDKQVKAILETKASVHIAGVNIQKDSSLKATQRLETEILNWGTCFSKYIKAQKAFLKFLNEWLLRCILQEPDETSDGIAPFSPGRIGAPPIFTVCNDWYHVIERVSESGVSKAIHDFASSLHQLQEMQVDELHQRLRVEYLSKDFARYLHVDCAVHEHQGGSLNSLDASEYPMESGAPFVDRVNEEIVSMKRILDEQKARHEEVVKQLNDAASGCLQQHLIPIFEALKSFCLENWSACEHIRLPSRDESI